MPRLTPERIITILGGEKNILSFTHCLSRLRFDLKDAKVVSRNLEKCEEATVIFSSDQVHVLLGKQTKEVFAELEKMLNKVAV
ncbi:MAG: PTS transporter subunit EIIB [Brevinema sp.]